MRSPAGITERRIPGFEDKVLSKVNTALQPRARASCRMSIADFLGDRDLSLAAQTRYRHAYPPLKSGSFMRGDLLELLINPYTGNRLERGTDSLVDTITRERFPIRNGIPAILRREEVRGLNRLYQKRYDGWAYLYDLIMGAVVAWLPGAREAFRQIAEIIEVQSSDRVLETSIGTGMEIANLVKHGKRADFFGLDLSHGMLKKCRRNAGKWKLDIGLVQGNAETVPFRDETFVARHDGAGKALHVLGRIEETMKRL